MDDQKVVFKSIEKKISVFTSSFDCWNGFDVNQITKRVSNPIFELLRDINMHVVNIGIKRTIYD